MAKRFKFRISRVIPSFQSCRSKDPSSLPSNPVPSFLRLSPVVNFHLPTITPSPAPPPSKMPHRPSLKSHVSSAFISVGCGFRSRPTLSDVDDHHEFQWEKEDKWHVVAKVHEDSVTTSRRKIYNSSASDDDVLPIPPPEKIKKKKRRVKKKRTTAGRVRISTSSADSCGLFFSSEGNCDIDEEENDTLVSSSRSFSTESSSEVNRHHQLETIREMQVAPDNYGINRKQKKQKKRKPRRSVSICSTVSSPEIQSPARLSVFQRLIPWRVDGKVRESFAVVKKSEDPYEDFRRSMMEMILEKQMFEKKDLEQLLHCFLSLNSTQHHAVIVEAFSEIWNALFSTIMLNN
ncbi:transcription repressor OFP7 [Quillaja saponaria]|uniref:Transcription repressor n=1 Tax=Quillaja saponaria TaxID=32244 RepID=A0AAD7KRD8_QUISA|nr:transcription repressor OFP7 [Quillaja saponaria]